MISSFSGDPFLATRAARRQLASLRAAGAEVSDPGEDITRETILAAAGQAGLFGGTVLWLDFDAAFTGQAGVKARNAAMKALAGVSGADAVVVDSSATPARQKQWLELGEHHNLPTPRFRALETWVASELKAAGVKFSREVPALMTELFGEDLPAIASEVNKLALLDGEVDAERLRNVTGKSAVADSFGFIDAVSAGDAAAALRQLRALREQDEDAIRILAAAAWQFGLVARCSALLQDDPRASDAQVAAALGQRPFVAQKVRRIAARLDEAAVRDVLREIAGADLASKTGRDPDWALEKMAVNLSSRLNRS